MKTKKYIFILMMFVLASINLNAQIKYIYRLSPSTKINGVTSIFSYDTKVYGTSHPTVSKSLLWSNFSSINGILISCKSIDTVANKYGTPFFDKGCIKYGFAFASGLYAESTYNFNAAFCKLDTSGITQILRLYNFNNPSRFDYTSPSFDGNLFVSGQIFTDTTSPFLVTTGNICKLDTAGNILWQYQRFGPYANQPGGMIATPDSGLLVSLAVGPWHNFNRSVLLKLDKAGHKQWEKFLPLPQGLYDVQLKGYYPEKEEYVVFVNRTDSDKNLIVRVDSNMQPVWQLDMAEWNSQLGRFAGTVNNIKRIQGGYIGIGYSIQGIGGRKGAMLVKIDDAGKKIWQAVYDTAQSAYIKPYDDLAFSSIDTMPDGGYIVSGSTFDSTHTQVGFLMRIDSNGCLTDGNCETRYFTGVSTINEELQGVRLYPNPASSSITIALAQATNESKALQLEIYDLLGRSVASYEMQGTEKTIPVSIWESGSYFCVLKSNNQIQWRGKFIKE